MTPQESINSYCSLLRANPCLSDILSDYTFDSRSTARLLLLLRYLQYGSVHSDLLFVFHFQPYLHRIRISPLPVTSVLSPLWNPSMPVYVFDRVLRLMVGTWEGVAQSLSAYMLNGLAHLVSAYGDRLKEDLFKDKLSRAFIKKLVRVTNKRRAGSMGFAEAILIYYNKKFM